MRGKFLKGLCVGLVLMMSSFVFVGCGEHTFGREIEVDGWTLFSPTFTRNVYILSANCESLVVDGVLHIPSRIGRHNIHGFGRMTHSSLWGGGDRIFRIDAEVSVEKIVLARELYVDRFFWEHSNIRDIKYIEFQSRTFERVVRLGYINSNFVTTLIIPDGSKQAFINKFGETSASVV